MLLGLLAQPISGASDVPLTKAQVKALLPLPSALGEGWEWVNPDRTIVDMGFQLSAFYYFRDPEGGQNAGAVVDVRVRPSAADAGKACSSAESRWRGADQVVVDKEPSLGTRGFLSHYGPHLEHGRRVTFCSRNVFVTIGPSLRGLEVAQKIWVLLE